MNRFSRRSLLSAAAIFMLPTSVGAQHTDPDEILSNLPGLETAFARRYKPISEAHSHDWPVEVSEATPEYCLVLMLTFADEAAANNIISSMLSPMTAGMIIDRSGAGLEQSAVESLPEDVVLFAGIDTEERRPYASLLMLPMAERIFLIRAEGETAAVQETANAIASFIADAEPVQSDVIVETEGVAQGGPFESLPGMNDADLLNGLYPFNDYDLLVSDSPIMPTESTPAASPAL